jgi:hypothetical protein
MSDTPTQISWQVKDIFGWTHLRNTARIEGDRLVLGCVVTKFDRHGCVLETKRVDTAVVYCASERQAIEFSRGMKP